jgi:hypothetical protein
MKNHLAFPHSTVLAALILAILLLVAVPVIPALAAPGDCDGTPSDDNIVCSTNPTTPDNTVGLGSGNDTYVQNAGVTSYEVNGDGLEDGSFATGNGAADTITINGTVTHEVNGDLVSGDGGDDTIIVNGTVNNVTGDHADGNGGNDIITVNGTASYIWGDDVDGNGGDDTITVNGTVVNFIYGDHSEGDGGNDTIIVNGTVGGWVIGDDDLALGGDDTIIINGLVSMSVDGDQGDDYIEINGTVQGSVLGWDGNDNIVLGANSIVGATVNGGLGADTLSFDALTQTQVNALGLNPAGDSTTINGHTYTWLNFESLLGLLEELAEEAGGRLRVFFAGSSAAAVETPEGDGMRIFAGPGRIAAISYASIRGLGVGESATYSTPNSAGWYVVVTNLGADPDHAAKVLYQVSIFSPGGGSAGQFTFAI